MKAGRTNDTGQLKPMKERMSQAELDRRQSKNEYRRTVSIEHAKTRGSIVMLATAVRNEIRKQSYWNYANVAAWLGLAGYLYWVS